MVEIKIEGLTKSYGKVEVLSNVTLTVRDGEFAVLMGPSGCGKTTLLRCVAGLEPINSGKVFIGSELANDIPPRDRDLSMVFQSFSLFPTMTVRENISFPLVVRRAPKQGTEERVREVARLLDIEGLLDKSPREISGGEQQRVAIGRALARDPKGFLMDEPLSSLDAPLRAQLRSELKRIQKAIGVTTLYVTHDQTEALALADEIGVLNRGSLLQFGRPQSVFSNPSSAFVARFVGDPQANILNVSLNFSAGAYFVEGPGLRLPVTGIVGDALRGKLPARDTKEREIQISVRPEEIEFSATSPPANASEGQVVLDEPLTLYRLLTVKMGQRASGSTDIKVLVSKDIKVEIGERVWLRVNPNRLHFFDRETGSLLT